ncbi:hypothetical protein F5Y07DRAFT_244723 [Xylaria sp. FL0933]|nr:hypothetical protein F5Y07DRAFT_244723 [Xylaria sp. FL0933]
MWALESQWGEWDGDLVRVWGALLIIVLVCVSGGWGYTMSIHSLSLGADCHSPIYKSNQPALSVLPSLVYPVLSFLVTLSSARLWDPS